jgi:hypothetical protein
LSVAETEGVEEKERIAGAAAGFIEGRRASAEKLRSREADMVMVVRL